MAPLPIPDDPATEDVWGELLNDWLEEQVEDALGLSRVERQAAALTRRQGELLAARVADAPVYVEPWTDTAASSGWTGSGVQPGNNRVYAATGLTRPLPTSERWVARATLHSPGTAGKYAYFGIGDGTNTLGLGQTSSSSSAFVNRSAGISSAAVIIPRTMPALTAGDYLVTIAKDETHFSLTIQPAGTTGQAVYGCRMKITDLPLTPTVMFLSANDTTVGGLNWGPLVVFEELALPPRWARTVGGSTLFGAGKPLVMLRASPAGIGQVLSIPGDLDSRVPAPLCLFTHQSLSGVAFTPWLESRWANVLAALEAAGYVFVTSDNGPGVTGGGTQDKYGNQAGLDDYAAAVAWARAHANTSELVLIGCSMGNYFSQNLLSHRVVGGIAAVAAIGGGTNMRPAVQGDPTYGPLVLAAYGASDAADWETKVGDYNPWDQDGRRFRGTPQRVYVGDADALLSVAEVNAFLDKVRPYAPEANAVVVPGAAHLADSTFQGSDLVAFFDRYVTRGAAALPQVAPLWRMLRNQPAVRLASGTDTVERFDIISDGTATSGWPNRRELRCSPVGGGAGSAARVVQYDNEYFEWRGNARQNTVLWRAFVREFAADAAHDMAVPIWEIQDDRDARVVQHAMYGQGNAYHKGTLTVDGTINGKTLGVQIYGVYDAGSEPAVPNGTIILVRP